MSFQDMMRDSVTLVKADGAVVRESVRAQVSKGMIITFEADLPLEPGDHFLRTLPSGLVEDYVVDDPNFMSGMGSIGDSFQAKVHRSHAALTSRQQLVQSITNNFHGANSRVTYGTDASVNLANQIQPLAVASLVEQIKPNLAALPEPQRAEIAETLREIENELRSGSPDKTKLQQLLGSVRTVAEGVAGNLVAAGIGTLIGQMLGG